MIAPEHVARWEEAAKTVRECVATGHDSPVLQGAIEALAAAGLALLAERRVLVELLRESRTISARATGVAAYGVDPALYADAEALLLRIDAMIGRT